MSGGGWLWVLVDVVFVAVLGIALAWAKLSRPAGHGDVRVTTDSLKADPEARRTGRYGRWQDWVVVLLGLWLAIYPWTLWNTAGGDTLGLQGNACVAGLTLALMGLAGVYRLEAPQEVASLIVAFWILISPWLLGFADSGAPAWNHWAVAVVAAICASWELIALRSMPAMRAPSDNVRAHR